VSPTTVIKELKKNYDEILYIEKKLG
jgi:hypothetical protein